jgi:hypothetical protein
MEVLAATVGAETAWAVINTLAQSQEHLDRLVAAIRGAENKKTVWYEMCTELVDNCRLIAPLLKNLDSQMRHGNHTTDTRDAVEDVLEVLNSALRDGTELVQQCRTSSTATLFFRGETMKAKFRKVADRITECLTKIPLAAYGTTLDIKRDVDSIVKSLNDAR